MLPLTATQISSMKELAQLPTDDFVVCADCAEIERVDWRADTLPWAKGHTETSGHTTFRLLRTADFEVPR